LVVIADGFVTPQADTKVTTAVIAISGRSRGITWFVPFNPERVETKFGNGAALVVRSLACREPRV
jgi:hypothetical protein